jgi:hypothetical protein
VYGISVLGVLLFTLWIGPMKLVTVKPRPVDAWLASQPAHSVLMQYPLSTALSGPAMLYTRYHHQPVVYGYGTYFPFIFRDQHPELEDFPADTALDQLAEWQVCYVLIDTAALSDLPDDSDDKFSLDSVKKQPRLQYVITLGDEMVYRLDSCPK